MKSIALLAAGLLATVGLPSLAWAQTESYTLLTAGKTSGHMTATTDGATTSVDYDYKDNGRGPTIKERLTLDASGLPTAWTIDGASTFGSKFAERLTVANGTATWTDTNGTANARIAEPSLYVGQNASPWALGLYARALLADADRAMPALPGGTLKIEPGTSFQVAGAGGPITVTPYTLSGLNTDPAYFLLDADRRLFATFGGRGMTIRKGYEGEEARLRALGDTMRAARFARIQTDTAHRYDAPIRIRNVRVFDSRAATLSGPKSVLVFGNRISAVEAADAPATPGEVTIDGAGGTLVPGMMEMHAHTSESSAALNLAAGITTMRDVGNNNAELAATIERIEGGKSAGSRIVRSGFIEGRSPFSSNNGIVVDSEAAAVEAVRWYGARGFWQIKIYNSIDPKWVPAMVAEARRLGMRVSGHVPAFTDADAMIAAGYDEITHVNQLMLGWILKPGEDTRDLLRLTALRRLPDLDLASAPVQRTLDAMVARKVAIDPTMVIHEAFTQTRNGLVPPGVVDYIDNMPVGVQRNTKQAWVDLSHPDDDQDYRIAFDQIVATLKTLHERGVMIVPGTDMGGAGTFHRELELFQRLGMTPAQVLRRATLDMAKYMGMDQQLGSIEKGKLADFFLVAGDPTRDLKAIKRASMVVKDGVVYFPSEIHAAFGIKPFAAPPKVTGPAR